MAAAKPASKAACEARPGDLESDAVDEDASVIFNQSSVAGQETAMIGGDRGEQAARSANVALRQAKVSLPPAFTQSSAISSKESLTRDRGAREILQLERAYLAATPGSSARRGLCKARRMGIAIMPGSAFAGQHGWAPNGVRVALTTLRRSDLALALRNLSALLRDGSTAMLQGGDQARVAPMDCASRSEGQFCIRRLVNVWSSTPLE